MSPSTDDDPPILDPRLDDLPIPRFIVERATAGGATTLRQLARIPPSKLAPPHSSGLAQARVILERYLGRTWEELAAVEPRPGHTPPLAATPRLPTCWDELRLALPSALRSVPLADLALPNRMLTYTTHHGHQTLGELARFSEAQFLNAPRLGRLTIHRTFLAVLAFAERAGGRVTMPPPVPLDPR